MAAHQSIIAALRVRVKGRPTKPGGRHGVIPAGTIGYIQGSTPYNAWDATTKIYNFYPNNFTETKSTLTDAHRIIVLAEDVVYHVSEASDPNLEPVVDIPICEAGYARIIGLSAGSGGVPRNLRRCVIEIDTSGPLAKFVLRELDGTRTTTRKEKVPVWAGRLLSKTKSRTAFIFAPDSSDTYDVEFFRLRPILHKEETPPESRPESETESRFFGIGTPTGEDLRARKRARTGGKLDNTTYAPPDSDDST
jgi:hypothetical protein